PLAIACNPISQTSSCWLIGVVVWLIYQGGPRKYQARPRAVAIPAVTTSIWRVRLRRRAGRSLATPSPGRPLAASAACAGDVAGSTWAGPGNSPVNHARQVGG